MSVSKLQEEFIELQKEIGAFQELLNLAIDESEISLEVLQHSIKSNIWELKVRLDDIALAIAQEKKNAKRKCELQQVAKRVFEMVKDMEVEINKAETIESNQNSTLEELVEAYKILTEIEKEGLPKLEIEYSKLPTIECEDSLRNKAFEEQMKMIENLKNIQSSILDKIETINMLNDLVLSFNENISSVSGILENAQFDVGKIIDIKNNNIISISQIVTEMEKLIKGKNIYNSNLLEECKEKLDVSSKMVSSKLAEAEKKVIYTITKKLEAPLKDINFESIEENIVVLPQQSPAYIELMNKINDSKARLNLQKKTRDELEIIVKALKEINSVPKKSLPVNEHILAFKKKLNDLTQYLKPKADSIILTGDADIDKDIKKQKEQLEEAIENVKKELESKELEKVNTDLVLKIINNVGELLSESEKQPNNSNLISLKDTFCQLKIKILNKLDELNTLNKESFNDNLKTIIKNNIKMTEEALKNTNLTLSNIEECETMINEFQNELNEIDISANKEIVSAEELIRRYEYFSQPFEVARNDIEIINLLFLKFNEFIKITTQIIESYKDYSLDNSMLIQKVNIYKNVTKNLKELKIKIEKDIKHECNLIDMKKHLQETLNQIAKKASILIEKVGSFDF